MNLPPWSLGLKIIACSFHSVAIACTIFRLSYRWYIARFWWEDTWAAFALAVDMLCLVSAAMDASRTLQNITPTDYTSYWMAALGFPCVLWACRISILISVVRVANPSQLLRRIAFFVGCSFVVMCAALIGQRIQICIKYECVMAASVGVSQLITDVISDFVLVFLPLYFLRSTKITRRQRILIYSVFSASLSITGVTILHSILLFTAVSSGIIVIAHVKAALSLVVCNLLVIVAFIYRVRRHGMGPDLDSPEEPVSFTNVDLNTGFTESGVDRHMTDALQVSGSSVMSHSVDMSLETEKVEGASTASDL